MNIYDKFKELNINYEEIEHEAVFTVEEAKKIDRALDGESCKNLFLKDRRGKYFLYVLKSDKMADLKSLRKELGVNQLVFTEPDELFNILGLTKGSVTPLAIINDKDNLVTLIIDRYLVGKRLMFHPNVNTKTVLISYDDLIRLIENERHKYMLY